MAVLIILSCLYYEAFPDSASQDHSPLILEISDSFYIPSPRV